MRTRLSILACLAVAFLLSNPAGGTNPTVRKRLAGGIQTRGITAPGNPGQAAHFVSASSQSLSVASNSSLQLNGTDFAFTCWVKPTDAADYRNIMALEGADESQANLAYMVRVNPGSNLETVFSNGANYFTTTGPAVSAAAWHFLAVSYNSSTGNVTRRVDVTTAVDPAASGPQTKVGTFSLGGGVKPMNGNIDAAALWKRQLTSAEMTALYASGNGVRVSRHPELWSSLVSGWELDDSGSTWFDWLAGNKLTNNNSVTSVVGIT